MGVALARPVPGKDRSREQEVCLLLDQRTAMARSIRRDRLTPDYAAALDHHRFLNPKQLTRLESIQS